jgi:type IV secretory pathway VirJ component
MPRLGQALVLLLVWSAASSAQQILYYEPLGGVSVFRPTSAPRHVAIVISGDAGLDLTARTIADHLAHGDTLVLGVDLRQYRERIAAGWADVVYPSADLELLSQFAQRALRVAAYDSPVLVGFDAGAALVYAALAEANPDTFLATNRVAVIPSR